VRLRQRITLPFVLLFAAAYVATALVVISLVAGAVERRLIDQTENLAKVMTGFPGPQARDVIKRAYNADAWFFEGGALLPGQPGTPPAFRRDEHALQPNGAVYAKIAGDRELVMVYDPALVAREKSDAVGPVVAVAAGGLVLVIAFGVVTARTISRPLERLAEAAREVSAGKTDVALPAAGAGEIGDLADALNRMLDAVRKGERLATMGQLSAGVAHEIKNPLSAMKMTVQMLREEQEAEAREPYDLVLREIERLELAASELSAAGPRPLARQRARLDAIANDVLDLMRRQLDHLRIEVARAFEAVPEVDVDVERMKRVVMNLVLNGAQAMPQGGRLTVALAPRDGGVRLTVVDTGPGIPPAMRDRVFEPFVTSKADGVGIGLALTKRIVEDHGGTIGFETSDRGTNFWVEVPRGDRPGH
jgi:signal transduction histidine kinase